MAHNITNSPTVRHHLPLFCTHRMESVGKRVRKTAIHEDNVSDYEPLEAKKRPRKNTTTACRERKNSWSEREDALLRSGVETYGDTSSSWMKIAPLFRGKRDSKQCRERWTEYINPAHSREPFSAAEDAALVKLQAEYGNSWRAIQAKLSETFTPRSATRIKSRWYQIEKKAQQAAASEAQSTSQVSCRSALPKEYLDLPQCHSTASILINSLRETTSCQVKEDFELKEKIKTNTLRDSAPPMPSGYPVYSYGAVRPPWVPSEYYSQYMPTFVPYSFPYSNFVYSVPINGVHVCSSSHNVPQAEGHDVQK